MMKQVFVINDFPYLPISQKFAHVNVLLERLVCCHVGIIMDALINATIETIKITLATKSNKIRGLIAVKIPIIVSPILSTTTHSCFSLINNKGYSLFLSHLSQLPVEIWSGNLVPNTTDWFDNNGSTFIVFENISCYINASCFFSDIFMLVGIKRVLELWELSFWPGESR